MEKYIRNSIGKYYVLDSVRAIFVVFLVSAVLFIISISIGHKPEKKIAHKNFSSRIIRMMDRITIPSNFVMPAKTNSRCSFYNCFNPYRCGKNGHQQIQVYIYPLKHYVTEGGEPLFRHITREFYKIIQAVRRSKYYTPNPEEACIFLPSFDTLSQNNFLIKETAQALNSLPHWNKGENHLIFNLFPARHASVMELATDKAMIAGAGFDSWNYRPSFDISLPAYLPIRRGLSVLKKEWLIISSQPNIHDSFRKKLQKLSEINTELVILDRCTNAESSSRCYNNKTYLYPDVLQKAVFCLVFRGTQLSQPILLEAMAFGCVPIILSDTLVMPFSEIIDWKRAVFFVSESHVEMILDLVKSVSVERIREMADHCLWLYMKYFNSIEAITNTTLDILNQRVFPENALFYEDWNLRPDFISAKSPLFLRTKSYSKGFTAVILTYDRIESLFYLIQKLASVQSLSMILIIWNNQRKSPPKSSRWPRINKQLKVIRTNENKLSNRFFPYKEIETEAILSLDDDISMLTEDELDFGFEVWREFPDRIVGFPSRTHVWNNLTSSWRYESEWTNEISMVLTGAAFYHKYWNFIYSTLMPSEIKKWIDNNMNCEDIAMNFLVSNLTNKAPIKVAPRKKFKCPECANTEMLSADLNHLMERSRCVNRFSKVFGRMPLQKVEFRADPVLYKDNVPDKLKRFKNIGNL